MATNISKVYLLNVPLEDDMKNTLYFANSTAQHNTSTLISVELITMLVIKVKLEPSDAQTKSTL